MKNKFISGIMLLIILVSFGAVQSYATESSNSGGDGKDIAFGLVESTPSNSAKAVKLDTQIKLLFNKNVVHFTVKDHNALYISLLDENNKNIPIDIIFPDDQIEPDRKREVNLKPKEDLKENTTYRVEISPEFKAKNGNSLGKKVSFSFTTVKLSSDDVITDTDIKTPDKPEKTPVQSENEAVSEEASTTSKKDSSNFSSDDTLEAEVVAEDTDLDSETGSDIPDNSEVDLDDQDESNILDENTETSEDSKKSSKKYVWPILLIVILVSISAYIIKVKRLKQWQEGGSCM